MTYLEVANLSLAFGEKEVLKDISLTIQKGELVTLLGPSGCGKSTLLRTIAGLEKPSQGQITLDGKRLEGLSSKEREVGMVFQSYALFPNMSVFDNIAFGLKVKKMPQELIEAKVAKMLALMELTDFKQRAITKLSGGQQQRVALARALIIEPKLLLLDEPLSALDARIRKQLQSEVRRIQQELGITMIFVTHDQEEAMRISDRIHILSEGELAQVSTPNEIYTRPANQFVAEFIGAYNQLAQADLAGEYLQEVNTRYFIRPEVIKFTEIEDGLTLPVTYQSQTVLGNTIRYKLMTESSHIIEVDVLNDNQLIPLATEVALYFRAEDIIKVSSAS